MEEEDNIIVKWAQEDVETSYNLLNKKNLPCLLNSESLSSCLCKNCSHDTHYKKMLRKFLHTLTKLQNFKM